MKKQVYEIDENGYVVEIYLANVDEHGSIIEENMRECISVSQPNGLYRPKWNGIEWIEGATQAEIDEINKPKPMKPSTEDFLLDLDYRLSTIEIGLGGI